MASILDKVAGIRQYLSGKKTYALLTIAVLVAVAQFAFGIDLGMSELKPAESIQDLLQQLWNILILGSFRAAIK